MTLFKHELTELRQKADKKDVNARAQLADYYYEKLIKHPALLYHYDRPRGIELKDERELDSLLQNAKKYNREAAAAENPKAMYQYGMIHILLNDRLGLDYVKRAADEFHYPEAEYRLACEYSGDFAQGDFEPSNFQPQYDIPAFEYFKKAADKGHVEAQYRLARLHNSHSRFSKDDTVHGDYLSHLKNIYSLEKSFKYFKLAADSGHAEARYEVALCYAKGLGVKQDYAEALKYFTLCSKDSNLVHKYQIMQNIEDAKKGKLETVLSEAHTKYKDLVKNELASIESNLESRLGKKEHSKLQEIKDLKTDLENLGDNFFKSANLQPDEIEEFKKNFEKRIETTQNKLSKHRHAVFENLLLPLTKAFLGIVTLLIIPAIIIHNREGKKMDTLLKSEPKSATEFKNTKEKFKEFITKETEGIKEEIKPSKP